MRLSAKMLSGKRNASRLSLAIPLLALIVLLQMLNFASHLSILLMDGPKFPLPMWTETDFPVPNLTTSRSTTAKHEQAQNSHEIVASASDSSIAPKYHVTKEGKDSLDDILLNGLGFSTQEQPDRYAVSSTRTMTTLTNVKRAANPLSPTGKRSSSLDFVLIPHNEESLDHEAVAKLGIPMWILCCHRSTDQRPPGRCLDQEWTIFRHAPGKCFGNTQANCSPEPRTTQTPSLKNFSHFPNRTLFTAVRNPYERFISEYYSTYHGLAPTDRGENEVEYQDLCCRSGSRAAKPTEVWSSHHVEKSYSAATLNHFLIHRLNYLITRPSEYVLQADCIFDENGNQLIHHVLRFENFHDEFHRLTGQNNISIRLNEIENSSADEQEKRFTVEDLYPETIARINQLTMKDFLMFGYEMRETNVTFGPEEAAKTDLNVLGTANGPPTVAFLFMTAKESLNEDLWNRWFPKDDDRYSIFVHTVASNTTVPLGPFFCPFAIPSVPTRWFELHDGMMQALQYAFEHDQRAQSFVFVSATSVPLVSFDALYRSAMEARNQSHFCWHKDPHPMWTRTRPILGLEKEDVRKAEMWSVISRLHAEWILESQDLLETWNKVFIEERRKATSMGITPLGVGAPDECLFPTLLTIKRAEFATRPQQKNPSPQLNNSCSTYVHWQRENLSEIFVSHEGKTMLSQSCKTGWPCKLLNLHEEGLKELRKRGYWMLRKVPPTAEVISQSNEKVPLNDALLMLHKGESIRPRKLQKNVKDDSPSSFSCPAAS